MSTSAELIPEVKYKAPSPEPGRKRNLGRFIEMAGRMAALALIILFFSIKVPNGTFLKADNVENILIQSAVFAMCGLGMTMIMISGGIDLAAGSTIALSMVVTALVLDAGKNSLNPDGTVAALGALAAHPFWWTLLAVAAAIAAASLVGFVQGLLITSLRLVPFIVTLGGMLALRGLTKQIADNQEISPPDTNWLYTHLMFPVQGVNHFNWEIAPPGVWATLVAAILAAGMLRYTKLGRRIYAIGSSEATARLCGVPVMRTKISVYAIAGIFTGLAGVLEFSKLNMGQPTGAVSYELYVIAACVIGGTSLIGGVGTIFGTIIGALMIGTLYAGTQQAGWKKYTQEEVIGITIIVAVALDGLRPRRE
jgi:ribose/xylose/arabinose/galactoside ABC-type transport system permease subunit